MSKKYPCMDGQRKKHYFGSSLGNAGYKHPSRSHTGTPRQNACMWCGFNKKTKVYEDKRYHG